ARAGRIYLHTDELRSQHTALGAQIDGRLSAGRVQAEAQSLGLAVPDPKQITYLSARDGDASRLANLLRDGSLMTQPSLPSSYPTGGQTFAPVGISSTGTSTTSASSGTSGTTSTSTSGSSGSSASGSGST